MTTFADLVPSPAGRFDGIERPYTPEDVLRLRGSVPITHTLAERGANRLWQLLHDEPFINALGAVTGNQAMQMVRAGLKAIYLSGWQVAADANTAGAMYPDQSLYPANAAPELCRRINRTLQRADQIEHAEGGAKRDWFVPIVADAEAGFGGPLNSFEIMKAFIEAGAAGVHFEDQAPGTKKCGHMGGKVLIPTQQHITTLNAARLAADVADTPTIVLARTDALAANLITTDVDERDQEFLTGERSSEGFYYTEPGMATPIKRALAYAPYADLIWCETGTPDLEQAREFAEAVKAEYPDQMLSYNCSPSFNWKAHLDDSTIAKFQRELGAMGYAFQFITLAGWHALNYAAFEIGKGYTDSDMTAYVDLQEREFARESEGYTAVKHQREVGAGYFDQIATIVSGGNASTLALEGSTEEEQFH